MKDSKRLRTLKLLTKWLQQEVTIANGYKHDLTNGVFRGRAYFTDHDPIPCVSIVENPNPDRDAFRAGGRDYESESKTSERWILLMQGWADEDKFNPTDAAYELMADVKKALAKLYAIDTSESGITINMSDTDKPRAYFLGGLTNGMEYEPGVVRPPEQPSDKAFFWMRVILKFTETVNDPYRY